jgi:hypothetical protein
MAQYASLLRPTQLRVALRRQPAEHVLNLLQHLRGLLGVIHADDRIDRLDRGVERVQPGRLQARIEFRIDL